MIKPALCGAWQMQLSNKKQRHGFVRSMQKSFIRSQGSGHSSQTKEKRSLKSITNRPNKPIVSSQFKKQAKESIKNQYLKDSTQIQADQQLVGCEKEEKKSLNSNFSIKQNRRKFESLQNRPTQNTIFNKNSQSQVVRFLYKVPTNNISSYQQQQSNIKHEKNFMVRNYQQQNKQKNLKKVESLIFNRQKSKSTSLCFLNKTTFDPIQKDKYSLKHHFSFANFKSPASEYQKESKYNGPLKYSETNPPFLRNTLTSQPIKKNQFVQSIQTQRQRVSQDIQNKQRPSFLTCKKNCLIQKSKKQRVSTQYTEKENQDNRGLKNQNTASMSRFFSLKTSRFFVPKRQQIEMSSDYKKVQEIYESQNIETQVKCQNKDRKKQIQTKDGSQNRKSEIQLEKQTNLSDSTRVSTFFDINNWKKRQIQNRFTQVNDSFMGSRFGFNAQNLSYDTKKSNFFNSKIKSRVSDDNFVYIQSQLQKSKQNLTEQQKIERNNKIPKRNTINHQSNFLNFSLNRNSSTKTTFLHKSVENNNDKSIVKPNQNETNNQKNKFVRNGKSRPSFFADFQRKKQSKKTVKIQKQKVILQKDQQQKNQTDQTELFSNIEIKDAQSVADSEFNASQKDSQLQFVLHSTDKIQLKSFAFLNTLQSDRKNFFKYK